MNRPQSDKSRRSTSWIIKLLLVMTSIGLTLLVLEIFIRIAGINDQFTRKVFSKNLLQISENSTLIYELKPGGSSFIDGVPNVISAQGLRDREYDIPKPPGVKRILILGDSVTYGLGVRLEDTFAKQLEIMLAEDNYPSIKKIEVLNMGVNGYKTVQEVEHLKVNGLRFEPDVVILAYNLNDPGDFSRELPYFNSWQNRQWTSDSMSLPAKIKGRLSQYSELAFMIEYRTLRLRLGKVVEDQPGQQPDGRRNYDGYFHLYRNAQAMNALETALDVLRDTAAQSRFSVVLAMVPLLMDFQDYRWKELHEQILALGQQRGFSMVDLLPELSSRVSSASELQRRHDDFEHPNPLGHRFIAEALRETIRTGNLLTETRSAPQSVPQSVPQSAEIL